MRKRLGNGKKDNRPPIPPKNLPAIIDPKRKTSPFEMNELMYEWIKEYLENGGDKSAIDSMLGIDGLYEAYKRYRWEYNRIKTSEAGQPSWEILKQMAHEMEEDLRVVQLLKKKQGKRKNDSKYEAQFQFLDSNIEYICNLIYTLRSNLWIAGHMKHCGCPNLTPIIFEYWMKETDKVDELIFAYKASANQHMAHAVEFMKEWLDPELHPELGMQHVGLVREIGLYHQRFAEYMDRKKFGKRIEVVDETPQKKYLEGKDLDKFLEGLDKSGREDAEEGDYEEVKNED